MGRRPGTRWERINRPETVKAAMDEEVAGRQAASPRHSDRWPCVQTYDPSPALRQTAGFVIPGMRPAHGTELSASATPIYDALYSEYRRLFRALPGDRSGEGRFARGERVLQGRPQQRSQHAFGGFDADFPEQLRGLRHQGDEVV